MGDMGNVGFDGLPPERPGRDSSFIPLPVVMSAFYQFAKAVYLLFVFWAVDRAGSAETTSGDSADGLLLVFPIFALIMVIAGFGLLGLRRWARHMLLAGGVLALPWLPELPLRLTWVPIVHYGVLAPYLPRAVMMTIVVIDVVVYATLVWYPDVAESFGEKRGDPYYSNDYTGN